MNKKNKKIIVIFLIFVLLLSIYYLFIKEETPIIKNNNDNNIITTSKKDQNIVTTIPNIKNDTNNQETNKSTSKDCSIKGEIFNINGSSMQPLIHNGDKVTLLKNYYNCDKNQIQNGDIIIFQNPFTKEKIIKKIAIIPGDKVTIIQNKGYVLINKKVIKNSLGEKYIFNEQEQKILNIYVNKDGIFTKGNYFLLGDNIGNSIDSRNYGPVSIQGILGKVIIK